MIDIAIISVPGVYSRLPQAAPALLKASVESHGFTCHTLDFNARFYQEDVDIVELESYFATGLNKEQQPTAEQLIEKWTEDILKFNPRYVGISVFTYQNRVASELFCKALRGRSDVKIILGGQGLSDGGLLGASGFGKLLVEQGLADFWIRSEGEYSLVELLKNNTGYPGINSNTFEQIEDLDAVPFPNYDDYDMSLYEANALPITGSRGCVRSCSFCDIHDHWKYRFRSGQNMADEIMHQHKKHSVNSFIFSDSLINGSLREFNKFIKILADYNRSSDKKISWTSQFIVRSPGQVSDQYWKDIADSGGQGLAIGVETGSDLVREHMNKKFSNADLDYTMMMLDKHNITCVFLMIVGYPTETDKDFQDTLDMFTRYQHLVDRIITRVAIGSTLGILPGTPLYNHAEENKIVLDKYENNWIALDNPDLTLEKRLQRREQLKQHLIKYGYTVDMAADHMMKILGDKIDMFNKRLQLKKMIRIKNVTQ